MKKLKEDNKRKNGKWYWKTSLDSIEMIYVLHYNTQYCKYKKWLQRENHRSTNSKKVILFLTEKHQLYLNWVMEILVSL